MIAAIFLYLIMRVLSLAVLSFCLLLRRLASGLIYYVPTLRTVFQWQHMLEQFLSFLLISYQHLPTIPHYLSCTKPSFPLSFASHPESS